ncbi:MAG: hypothetical protein RhofKO_39570 [Rhodothermales bacterium]
MNTATQAQPTFTTTLEAKPGHVWDVTYSVFDSRDYYGASSRFKDVGEVYEIERVADTIFGGTVDTSVEDLELIEAHIITERATFRQEYSEWSEDLEAAFAMETDWRATVPADVPGFPWV